MITERYQKYRTNRADTFGTSFVFAGVVPRCQEPVSMVKPPEILDSRADVPNRAHLQTTVLSLSLRPGRR